MIDVLILGAGPSSLFAADRLSAKGFSVTVIESMPSPARKFLIAGRGGLNLTHSEDLTGFLNKYQEATGFLEPLVREFSPQDLRSWCHELGQETFVGSSGRIFPKSMKSSPLLRAWLRRLEQNKVRLLTRHRFMGFSEAGSAQIQTDTGETTEFPARAVLLGLGGASWPKLGSDAAWVPSLEAKDIQVTRLQPANCGFLVPWSPFIKERYAGSPLKHIAISLNGRTVQGEAVLSEKGLEGGAVYALSADIRETINREGSADLAIDLRPTASIDELREKLSRPRDKQSISTFLRKTLKLKPVKQALLREAGPLPQDPSELAARIKSVPVRCEAAYSIDRAISSAGGIALDEVDEHLMLKKMPGVFAAGEMLDWEAPTGGYLLQACFAMGYRAAKGISSYLSEEKEGTE
jgi:uncharacterized flavoprotein (TIGR03862 family)